MVSKNIYTIMNTTKMTNTTYILKLYCKGPIANATITVNPFSSPTGISIALSHQLLSSQVMQRTTHLVSGNQQLTLVKLRLVKTVYLSWYIDSLPRPKCI